MRTINCIYIGLVILLVSSCKRDDIKSSDVISDKIYISNRTPYADGSTILDISATLNEKADADKSSVIFTATSGQFIVANDTIITQKATFQSGKLTANVRLRVPFTSGTIFIKAYPATTSPYFSFLIRDTITLQKAIPDKLVLNPSALGIASNFGSEISLNSALSFKGKSVSTGNKVLFEDYFPGGAPVGGRFRTLKDTTDLTSAVSAAYGVGVLPVGTSFYLKCTWLDANGKRSLIKDSTLITINK